MNAAITITKNCPVAVVATGNCVPGEISGWQRIVKIVDENEVTIRIVQEILDDKGVLIESHQKFPRDTGHVVHGTE